MGMRIKGLKWFQRHPPRWTWEELGESDPLYRHSWIAGKLARRGSPPHGFERKPDMPWWVEDQAHGFQWFLAADLANLAWDSSVRVDGVITLVDYEAFLLQGTIPRPLDEFRITGHKVLAPEEWERACKSGELPCAREDIAIRFHRAFTLAETMPGIREVTVPWLLEHGDPAKTVFVFCFR